MFDLDSLAVDWNTMFLDLIEDKKTNPISSYQVTPAYEKRDKVKKAVKLNIAAGTSIFPSADWINIDKYDFSQYFNFIQTINTSAGMPNHQKKLWEWCQEGNQIECINHDMTKPFTQFKDNSVDFIYLGQCFEHLNFKYQAPSVLKECYRMLKPGGIVRITTPDFNKILITYNNNEMHLFNDEQPDFYKDLDPLAQMSMLIFGASGDSCTQEKYEGHFFCHTVKSMTGLLEGAGFKEVDTTWPKCGKNKEIAMEIEDFGFSHSMIIEGVK